MKKIGVLILLSLFALVGHAQNLGKVRDMYGRIDSMHYAMRGVRDSIRYEIKSFRDSLRYARRHAYDAVPHTIRIGWGDQMFENLMWRDRGYYTSVPQGDKFTSNENFRYTQHCFVEYMYSVNYWYSFGLLTDYSGVIWDQVTRNHDDEELLRENNRAFHNIAIVPTVRFSYFHHDYVSLYSALGVGVNINTGTELDYKDRYTAAAPVVNITLLGLRAGKGRWYGAVEVGGMFSLCGADELYMLGSRIFTASVGVRF